MDATEILNLLKYGEHINLECKKQKQRCLNLFGKLILHLQILMVA